MLLQITSLKLKSDQNLIMFLCDMLNYKKKLMIIAHNLSGLFSSLFFVKSRRVSFLSSCRCHGFQTFQAKPRVDRNLCKVLSKIWKISSLLYSGLQNSSWKSNYSHDIGEQKNQTLFQNFQKFCAFLWAIRQARL